MFWRVSNRFILVLPEAGKLRSLLVSCSLLEKSKWRLNRVKCASRIVKRLKIIAIHKVHLDASVPIDRSWTLPSGLVPGRVVVVTSTFSLLTLGKQSFQTAPFSNRSTLESVFALIRFRWYRSFSVFGVVVWTVFENGVVWTGSKLSGRSRRDKIKTGAES